MAQLAIKGYPTRGSEVIALLEMLGGKNIYKLDGEKDLWYILSNSTIEYATYCFQEQGYTLDEFEARFPYKVGDKVISQYGKLGRISRIIWSDKDNQVRYELESDVDSLYFANELQVLKNNDMETDVGTVDINLADHFKSYKVVEISISDGWEFEQRGNKMFAISKQYPKTYVECAKILNCFSAAHIDGYKSELLDKLQELLICRDAYWKIAGEQIGLGKPWEPDYNEESYEQGSPKKYVIYYTGTYITKGVKCTPSHILAFPTEEMRDAFFENFKDLIEQCKELL